MRWLCASTISGQARRRLDPSTTEKSETCNSRAFFNQSGTVQNIQASRAFYELLGFRSMGDSGADDWMIPEERRPRHRPVPGMFDRNILTFNPGWDQNAQPLAAFTDIRERSGG